MVTGDNNFTVHSCCYCFNKICSLNKSVPDTSLLSTLYGWAWQWCNAVLSSFKLCGKMGPVTSTQCRVDTHSPEASLTVLLFSYNTKAAEVKYWMTPYHLLTFRLIAVAIRNGTGASRVGGIPAAAPSELTNNLLFNVKLTRARR